ncbi:MAG TPA: 1,4-alpha-glucan branching protein GlgB [Victivallales bacterium]|nr:1,4-alpha-glucan branching protein GlgB [Victivallales bacterium]
MSKNLLPSIDELQRLLDLKHNNPHSILGMHYYEDTREVIVRAFDPDAEKMIVVDMENNIEFPMEKLHEKGIFSVSIPERSRTFKYELVRFYKNSSYRSADPYCFLPGLGSIDEHLFNEGEHRRVYEIMGAHLRQYGDVKGTLFTVWAPNAARVSVVGDFNLWDGRKHQMRLLGSSGIWEIFIPDVAEGAIYKFEILAKNGAIFLKQDPYSYWTELRPKTASRVSKLDFKWTDSEWIERRKKTNYLKEPINIYEVHLGSWRGSGLREVDNTNENDLHNYREIAHVLADYVIDMGYTHVELLPIMEHPFDQSWGYQVTGYYAPTSRYGTPEDFAYFVDYMHSRGIGVFIDWVPAHFPKDDFSLGRFDGTALYEHLDPRQGEHEDWGTYIFNYGRNEVRNFLIGNALYWLEVFHVDGLRVDAVASMLYLDYSKKDGNWIPNQFGGKENIDAINFMKRLNELTHQYYPGTLMIAEESTAWAGVTRPAYLGGLGFTCKWNMGWMHDTLEYFSKDPVFRKYHHDKLTFSLWYAFSENFILPFSHDEVVHEKKSLLDKMSGDYWQKFANLRLMLTYMMTHPGKKLNFMGYEIGQWNEWYCKVSLDWNLLKYPIHKGLQKSIRDLNKIYKENSSLWEVDFENRGFEWIDISDVEQSVFSYLRWNEKRQSPILVVLNCTPVPRYNYKIGAPYGGEWLEIFNSDSEIYGGSGIGNKGRVIAVQEACHGRPFHLNLTLPPLGALIFKTP